MTRTAISAVHKALTLLLVASISIGPSAATTVKHPGAYTGVGDLDGVRIAALATPKAPARHHAQYSSLPTGNGFGFAVVSPTSGAVTSYFAHPYKYERRHSKYKHPENKPDQLERPDYILGEGISTANFIKNMTWKMEDRTPDPAKRVEYLQQSQMVAVQTAKSRQNIWMPFGIEKNVLVTTWQPMNMGVGNAYLDVSWAHPVRSHKVERLSGLDVRVLTFDGIKEGVIMIPLDDYHKIKGRSPAGLSGHQAWALVSMTQPYQPAKDVAEVVKWIHNRAFEQLIDHELAEVERWRALQMAHFDSENELKLWRQSEMILRMAQSREPNTEDRHGHGMIVASLPDGGWFCPWARDMVYATTALIRMGHQREARFALDAFLNAQPVGKMQSEVGGYPYQVSVVRYFGDGEEEPYFTYEGADNVELDGWGLALGAIGEYTERYHDYDWLLRKTYRGSVYEDAKTYIMKPLLANLEPYGEGLIVKPDTSIWEERQKDRKHFCYTTAAALAGLKSFDKIVERKGDEALHQELKRNIALLEKGFSSAFIRDGTLRGTLEDSVKNNVDGATMEAIYFGLVNDDNVIRKTLEKMKALKAASGGYKRVQSIVTDPRVFEYWYERQEFVLTNFGIADAYLRIERPDAAAKIVDPIVFKASVDHHLIPEMYVSEANNRFKGDLGDPTGAVPMVGYGAGAFISYVIDREARGYGPSRIHRH